MYFGLLRGCEVFQIDKDFLMFEDDGVITVNFSKGTKTRAKGFAFDIPASFREAFELYWSQIATEGEKNYSAISEELQKVSFKKVFKLREKTSHKNFEIC